MAPEKSACLPKTLLTIYELIALFQRFTLLNFLKVILPTESSASPRLIALNVENQNKKSCQKP